MVLGGFGADELVLYQKVPVALAARIPVKVSTENGPIEMGDRIVPSSTPGVGMRASSRDEPGVIGIALEPYEASSEGRILVLVK